MDRIRRLENPIQAYAWGSRTALAELQGRPSPAPGPEAELWVGAHPIAPSSVHGDAGLVPLPAWIARDPAAALGPEVAARFDGELPFLMKVIAVAETLSLQAHPDAARARQGFAAEEARGVPRDAAERSYRDPRPKLELACALGPFRMLLGFRPPAEILTRFGSLGVPALDAALVPLRRSRDAAGWRRSFAALAALAPEAVRAAAATRHRADADPSLAWVARLAAAHPGDPGVLAPVYLHYAELGPGQAGRVAPGVLHTHLEGMAVEVMTNSDNVVRGGLTAKHVDRDLLLQLLDFDASSSAPVGRVEDLGRAACEAFEVERVDPAPGAPAEQRTGVALVLCTEGAVAARESGGDPVRLPRGAAAFVPAAAGPWRIEGEGQAWCVRVP